MSKLTTHGAALCASACANPTLVTIARRRSTPALPSPRSVALVALDWTRAHDPRVPLGHASIETALRAAGIRVTPLVFSVSELSPHAEDRLVDRIVASARDVIAIGVYAWNVDIVMRMLPRLRRRTRSSLVLGGPQITYAGAQSLRANFPEADAFIRGAGEAALVGLLTLPWDEPIDGVTRATGPVTETLARIDLARLWSPFLRGVVPMPQDAEMVRWETARGCPYNCSFCAHSGAPESTLVARRPREVLRQEIELFVLRKVKRLNVLDPLFNANQAHAVAVLDDLIAAGFRGEVTFQVRFLAMKGDTSALLDRFQRLNVELEFGLQTTDDVVARAVRRVNEIDVAARVIKELHERRIRFMTSVIYGLPFQTLASFKATLAWCAEQCVPVVRAYPLSLLVGTELWHRRHELGLVEGFLPEQGSVPAVVETPWMSRTELAEARALALALPG